jgi:hypothetical protein
MFNTLSTLALAPLQRWAQTPLMHKVVMAGAGAGVAYYLHKKGMADAAVAAGGVGAAYGASMLMHAPALMGPVPNGAQAAAPALPPAQVNGMVQRAQAALSQGVAQGAAAAMSNGAQQPATTSAPLAAAPPPNPSSPWAGLG